RTSGNSSALFTEVTCSTGLSVFLPERGSLLDHLNRKFRAIGSREPRLVLEARRHSAVAALVRVAEFVQIEQFRRQRFAARVTLTFLRVDAYLQLPGHQQRSSLVDAHFCCARCVCHRLGGGAASIA